MHAWFRIDFVCSGIYVQTERRTDLERSLIRKGEREAHVMLNHEC